MTSNGPCHLASNLELAVGSNTSTFSPGANLRSLVPRLYNWLCLSWACNKFSIESCPKCGVLFSGPAHAEFRFCSLKVPPPKFPQDIQNPPGLASVEELEGGKPRGGLRDLAYREQKGFQPLVPIFCVLMNELTNHGFQSAIKSFHQAVRLWVKKRWCELI